MSKGASGKTTETAALQAVCATRVLAQLTGQDRLYLAFYGDDLGHRFTGITNHDRQQWQYLDEPVAEAVEHWQQIPPEQRDFDRDTEDFVRPFV